MVKTRKSAVTSTHRSRDRQGADSFGDSEQPDLTYGRVNPDGLPTSVYVPTTIEEYQFIGTVLATGWKAGKSVLHYYQKSDSHTALTVSVVRSEPTPNGYRLDFQFANVSPHSVYIENLLLLNPKEDVDANHIRLLSFTLHDTASLDRKEWVPTFASDTPKEDGAFGRSRRDLPMLIKREDKPQLSLLVKPDAKLWFDTAKVGIARATVSFLGEEARQSVAWRFLLRHK